ncbi:MAG TPA: helix-turn-helix transcriptional regulator [Candidatus Limnocylindrales bacterium]
MDYRIARVVMGSLRDRDRTGFELWHWVGPVHGEHEELSEATLYPILYGLEARRLIGGTWRETEQTRRLYRLASRGVDTMARRNWPATTRRTEIDPILTATEPAKADDTDGTPQAITAFLDRLEQGLRLSEVDTVRVRDEIRHHLDDSGAALIEGGMRPAAATAEALARLGPPEVLAEAINSAKLTRRRLFTGLRSASIAALFGGTLGLAAAGLTLAFTPIIARYLTFLASFVGIHLYAPENGVWWSQQLTLTACVAAFMAARRSLPYVAQHTGRAESLVRPIWALAGGLLLGALALLLPANLDVLVVVGLLGIPACFVAGTWLSQGHEDDLVSKRGILGATILLAVLLLAPGFRVWAYDPSAGPAAAPPPAPTQVQIAWESGSAGGDSWVITVPNLDAGTWHDARLEFWPAVRDGLTIAPDRTALQPAFTAVPGATFDLGFSSALGHDWWVDLTAAGPDGSRQTLATSLHYGASGSGRQTILGLIFGNR